MTLHGVLKFFTPLLPKTLLEIYDRLEIDPPKCLLPAPTEAPMSLDADSDVGAEVAVEEPLTRQGSLKRRRSPSPPTTSSAMHPLLSRTRSVSIASSAQDRVDAEADGSTTADSEATAAPSREPAPYDPKATARRVLQRFHTPKTVPEEVDLRCVRERQWVCVWMAGPRGCGGERSGTVVGAGGMFQRRCCPEHVVEGAGGRSSSRACFDAH